MGYTITVPGTAAGLERAHRWVLPMLAEQGIAGRRRADVDQVLTALGRHAIRHTASGDPDGTYRITVDVNHGAVCIEVVDQGPTERVYVPEPGDGPAGIAGVAGIARRAGYRIDARAGVATALIDVESR